VAERLVDALGADAVLVPMDGFHLADASSTGSGGATARARRTPSTPPATCPAPPAARGRTGHRLRPDLRPRARGGRRRVHRGPQHTPLVVTEGNYLLLDDEPWRQVRPLLHEAWFVAVDPALGSSG
jgi:hypothetical protein